VTLLADRAWGLPRSLDRILPNVSLEGHMVAGVDPIESGDGLPPAAPGRRPSDGRDKDQAREPVGGRTSD